MSCLAGVLSFFKMSVAPTPTNNVRLVKRATDVNGKLFISKVESLLSQPGEQRIAFDCEGVNLCRLGTLELVSICFPTNEVFLIDLSQPACSEIVNSLKKLFESYDVTKIIHDCRMDCDALFHLHNVSVNNVHDTSCFHHVITSMENKNLNDVLSYNGIRVNTVRDTNVYKRNPRFWATRPVRNKMIQWASSDVDKLFLLADMQLSSISVSGKARARSMSEDYSQLIVKMNVRDGLTVTSPGRFIGRGGANIRSTERELGVFCYQGPNGWFAFYPNELSLDRLRRKMANA